jgi:glutathione peroxidase-family protein
VNEFLPKVDKVYDADNLEQCYNIWRSKNLYIEGLAT